MVVATRPMPSSGIQLLAGTSSGEIDPPVSSSSPAYTPAVALMMMALAGEGSGASMTASASAGGNSRRGSSVAVAAPSVRLVAGRSPASRDESTIQSA